jgi:hypothetical protein
MKKTAVFVVVAAFIVICFGLPAEAQNHRTLPERAVRGIPVNKLAQLKADELKVMDTMIRVYGETDLSDLADYIAKGNANGSPNNIVPFISLGQAYLNRYEEGGRDLANFAKALDYFELAAREGIYRNWGNRWASTPTLAYLLLGIYRAKDDGVTDASLSVRVDALFSSGEILAEGEADARLTSGYPYKPYISGTPEDGDTKAEENAWEAYFLAWASQMYPNHPRAALWEAKARELAFYSIVRQSEGVTFNGEPFSTVEDDFTLTNHWIRGNPYYGVATVQLLRMGALAYRMAGQEIPEEFEHNVLGLYANYKVACGKDASGRYTWLRNANPVGDPTLFPIAGLGDDTFERNVVRQKAVDGYLWLPTEPVTGKLVVDPELGLKPGTSLGVCIQNAKVFWYYLGGSYLWHFHFPPKITSHPR